MPDRDGTRQVKILLAGVGSRGAVVIRAGVGKVTGIPESVPIGVGAGIAGVTHAVPVPCVLLAGVGRGRTIVEDVAYRIAVPIILSRIRGVRAIVCRIGDAIAVRILTEDEFESPNVPIGVRIIVPVLRPYNASLVLSGRPRRITPFKGRAGGL